MLSQTAHDSGVPSTTIWLSALEVELAPLRALMGQPEAAQVAGLACWRGRLRGRELVAAVCGAGGDACRTALEALLADLPGPTVLVVGTAGALDPGLAVGDVVVANRPIAWPGDPAGPSSPQPVLGATASLSALGQTPRGPPGQAVRVVPGCVLTWDSIVYEPTLKAKLREVYGADCVDMETGHAAQVCAAGGVPFLAVRGISDSADAGIEDLCAHDLAIAAWRATLVAVESLGRPSSQNRHAPP